MKDSRETRALLRRLAVTFAIAILACGARTQTTARPQKLAPAKLIDVTVHEGTSMSVAVSPDGKMLAIDLQGSIWTLPASGGTANPHYQLVQ